VVDTSSHTLVLKLVGDEIGFVNNQIAIPKHRQKFGATNIGHMKMLLSDYIENHVTWGIHHKSY